ncbi:MAG TPA: aminopeptidase P N-terminal domain-containing protein [Vicinamibacterales bacterium]|jgi:Xaa-Pro aminopeptidase|nr:aminopeptidase P N-terminal domain-containing protein [Vicinamibacterales bacterium]
MKTQRARGIALTLALLLLAASARASDLSVDVTARRARLASLLGARTALILWSAPTRNYSGDVDYEYRQESNLYYLTGIAQEETILVMLPGSDTPDVLFIKPHDPSKEHWFGRVLTPADATARSGVPTVMTIEQFAPFIDGLLSRGVVSRLALLLPPPDADRAPAAPTREEDFAKHAADAHPGLPAVDATPMLTSLRLVKTAYEQQLLVKCLQISSDAQKVGMRTARPDAFEYQVKAAIEGTYRGLGAASWAYPSIVGSGPNATILHYPDDDRQMKAGELLLVDAAANYQYIAGDITRTYPVGGTFTPAQKDIYAIVLAAQDAGTEVARAGNTLATIHNKTVDVIKAGLLRLGLITDTKGDQYKIWYTHGASHFIGVDVHDVGERGAVLEPGMAFTIEPGIYIRQSALDTLPETPDNAAFIAAVQPAVRKYLDIGVRVEDSFLLETGGPRRLSASVPRTIEDIEAFMRKR